MVGLVIKNRVTADEELEGLDVAIHGESAYEFGPTGGGGQYLPSGASKETVTA